MHSNGNGALCLPEIACLCHFRDMQVYLGLQYLYLLPSSLYMAVLYVQANDYPYQGFLVVFETLYIYKPTQTKLSLLQQKNFHFEGDMVSICPYIIFYIFNVSIGPASSNCF